jgi:Fur family ferric uptake transcriptional regulator
MPRNRCRKSWIHGKFKGCGYKITVGRQAILDILSKANKHLSAEDIYLKVHEVYPSVGLTTVYRTLDILQNLGLIIKHDFGDGRARFELSQGEKSDGHHHHLVCTNCNRVIEYKDFIDREVTLLKETEKELSKKYNFNITSHLIQFYGLCEKCNSK